nr:hypothetical protein [Ardenticatena sp.]
MPDLSKLADPNVREALLLAEVAAWLHNIGKLEPNFLVMQTGESPDILESYRIPGQYTFKRFCKPTVLLSQFPYENLKGPLYFLDFQRGQEIRRLERKIREIQQQLQSLPQNVPERSRLGQELQRYNQQLQQRRLDKEKREQQTCQKYEQKIEQCPLFVGSQRWPLGSLLTMFWESEWFDKPNNLSYEPGSGDDPDYQRIPKPDVRLQAGLTMEDMPALLLLAHGEISGQEKKGFDPHGRYIDVESYEEKPEAKLARLRLSSAFGYETELPWQNWMNQRQGIVNKILCSWGSPLSLKNELAVVLAPLLRALGDTQRPINEISLWDYSAATAALFKGAIAQAVFLGQMPTPATMRWRLLAVRLDAWDFLFQAQQVADLIARQHLLDEAYRVIKHLLEVEYPLSSAVYSDEHGFVFVIPELPGCSNEQLAQEITSQVHNALDNPNSLGTLKQAVILYGPEDVRPSVIIGPPRRGKKLNLSEVLKEEPVSVPPPEMIRRWWESGENRERCMVCGLRPQGYVEAGLPSFVTSKKAEERQLCGICLARRGRRAEAWATTQPDSTIWIDEVADVNGRFALIVGRFAMDDWISGLLVRSMAVGTDKDGNWLAKPPTFARIHRVWRTMATFWEEINNEMTCVLTDDRRRIRFYLDRQPDLGNYHTYELELGSTTISVVWVPPDGDTKGYLISADNLQYIAKLLGASEDLAKDPATSAIFVEDFVKERIPWQPVLRNPEAKMAERTRNLLAGFRIVSTEHQEVSYCTAIPILAEPRTFMALVPADKALDVVRAIKAKYEREMGKVRNRLPLHLGVVYADSHTPLRTVLDAGRRMLAQKAQPLIWKVVCPARKLIVQGDALPERFESDQEGQFKEWFEIFLEARDVDKIGQLTWYVPAVMGDGQTEDHWYPYVFWQQDKDGKADPGNATQPRTRYYQAPNPFDLDQDGNSQSGWLVHAGELEKGDLIYFTPATFDFQWLGSGGQRFEIAYDQSGRRFGTLARPYLLDEVEAIVACWEVLSEHLSTNQIHALRGEIESKRAAWFDKPEDSLRDATFEAFCWERLTNAEWKTGDKPNPDDMKRLVDWAVRGLLADAVELYHHIMKRKA